MCQAQAMSPFQPHRAPRAQNRPAFSGIVMNRSVVPVSSSCTSPCHRFSEYSIVGKKVTL